MHPMRYIPALYAALCLVAPGLAAAPATQPTVRPAASLDDDDNPVQYLAPYFISRASGIAFRPPLRGAQATPASVGTSIVQFVNTDEKWIFKASQMIFESSAPLVGKDDPATPLVDESKTKPGVLIQTAQQLLVQNAGNRVLRHDLINVGPNDAGLIILRFTQGSQACLRQVAIIQRNDQHYYVLDLTTRSTRTAEDLDDAEDPSETIAVRIFRAIIDSAQLLDLSAIRADNDQRLYAARALLVNVPTRLKQIVTPEQYLRIQRDGTDVGWSFVAEELAQRQGQSGVIVAIRSQAASDPGSTVDVGSEMFCADNRRNEAWVTLTVVEKDGKKQHVTEFGQSDKRVSRKLQAAEGGDPKDPGQPLVRVSERYLLTVTQSSAAAVTPVTRELSPYYLPQALSHFLPRLVPLNEPKGYLFVVWVSGEREIVHRYLDVQPERTVTFAGKPISAVVVKDRIGLEGEPTYHYLTRNGRYLGSESPAANLLMIATDQNTLTRLYPNANIVRPRVLDTPTDR